MKEKDNNTPQELSRRNFLTKAGLATGAIGLGSLNVLGATSTKAPSEVKSNGKVAVVTGSSRGIGAAIARQLANDGFKVVVNCLKNDDLAKNVANSINRAGGEARWLQADVRNTRQVKALFDFAEKEFGGIDVVINNAGIMNLAPFAKMEDEDFDNMMDTNIKGGFLVLREAARRVRNGGRIISTSSSITLMKTATYGPYAASKAALQYYSSCLAKELAGKQIAVNAVAPGVVNTPLFTDGKTQEQIKMFEQRTPNGRLGEPEDIALTVSTLCSEASAWINGQTIYANGGLV